MLDILSQDGQTPGHDAIYVGDVKLSDFRSSIAKSNFSVQFDQGTRNIFYIRMKETILTNILFRCFGMQQ